MERKHLILVFVLAIGLGWSIVLSDVRRESNDSLVESADVVATSQRSPSAAPLAPPVSLAMPAPRPSAAKAQLPSAPSAPAAPLAAVEPEAVILDDFSKISPSPYSAPATDLFVESDVELTGELAPYHKQWEEKELDVERTQSMSDFVVQSVREQAIRPLQTLVRCADDICRIKASLPDGDQAAQLAKLEVEGSKVVSAAPEQTGDETILTMYMIQESEKPR